MKGSQRRMEEMRREVKEAEGLQRRGEKKRKEEEGKKMMGPIDI